MSEAVRFMGDGQKALWPLPFTPAGADEIAVSIIRPGMAEASLLYGRDFSLQGNVLICMVPAGGVLAVARREGAAGAAMMAARLAAPSYEASAAPLSLEEAGGDLEEQCRNLAANLKKEAEAAVKEALSAISEHLRAALETALAAVAEQGRKGVSDAALASAPAGQRARLVLERGAESGAYLTLPVSYFPGMAGLLIWLNGVLLAPGEDYSEIGPLNESSNLIRLMRSAGAGAVLDMAVLPTPSSELAERSAAEAKSAQRQAAVMLAEARDAQSAARAVSEGAGEELALARGWAEAAQKCAEDAWEASRNVYDMAAQVTMRDRRPGVSAVKSLADIHACSPGLFIVNPHLTHAPTPFFGVWPAQCLEAMAWDGVFFMGGQCYPDDPALPPKRPPRPKPAPKPAIGDGDDWLPCDHAHPGEPPSCSCPPMRPPRPPLGPGGPGPCPARDPHAPDCGCLPPPPPCAACMKEAEADNDAAPGSGGTD